MHHIGIRLNVPLTVLRSSYVVSTQPTEFELGHLVELQISVAVVPISNGRFKILNRLRSVCLLDRTVVAVGSCFLSIS